MDLANIKTRLIGCGAIQLIGQTISAALSGSTAATLGGAAPLVLVGSVLGTIAASVAGGMMATELGNHITQSLSKNPKILNNHDLTIAAGEAIAYILKEVAQSEGLIAIAETQNLSYQAEPLNQLADKTVEYWLNINTNTANLSTGLKISEDQLNKIFSGDAEEFDEVTGLTADDWQIFVGELAASQGKSFDVDVIKFVANRLYESFPKAFREVLKDDAKTGGQKFAAMVLNLHQIALGELKDLGLQTGEILQKLEAIATRQQVCDLINKLDAIALDIRDDLAQVKASLQRLVDTSATKLPLPYECETIIQERTQDFTGRKFVFEAIVQFLQQNPKGYFVLEAEPGVGKSSIMAKLVLLLKRRCVAHFNSQSQGTVKAEQFIDKRTSNSASIQNWIKRQNLQRQHFVETVAEKSQNNFMYLRYVLNDIDSGKYSDVTLNDLPLELEGYYQKHWARMEMVVKDKELRRRKLKVIYLLTKVRKPVSCDILADFAEEDALDVQEVLDDWEQFLRRSGDISPDYSIYHASFQRFLYRIDVVQKAGVSLRDIETAISDNLWGDLYGDE
ncbi:hypothetical protein BCD67_10060 [Oscillatoriales cyanobacterium USR001]|nr:hypothetical protein BCD67_10060 [Oscillatoriales cyanobacterium USR001]